jgi:hypothetical protein
MNCGVALNLTQPPEHPQSYHMAHIRNKRMWGDSIENVKALCGSCHRDSHNAGGKPCPPKGDAYDKSTYRFADKVPAEEQE